MLIVVLLTGTVVAAVELGSHHGRAGASEGRPHGGVPQADRGSGASGGSTTSTSPTTSTSSTAVTTTTAVTATTAPPPPPVEVGLARCTMVDPTRSTYDYANGRTIPGRTLPTEIRYPTRSTAAADPAGEIPGAPPAARPGGYPTVFFAPGYDVTPDAYTALLDAWVEAGFVVVAPSFPDTNPTAVAAARVGYPEDDLVNQPADLAFVVRTSLQASAGGDPSCSVLSGLVDPAGIALAGQSDGGDTVALLAYGRSGPGSGLGAALPVKATAVLSGSEWPGDTYAAAPGDPPLLVVQSTTDQCNPPQASTGLYDAIGQQDKWFLTLEGVGHLGPYDGVDEAAFQAVVAVTTRFFRLELSGAAPGAGFLAYGSASPAVARLTTGPAAPALAPLAFEIAACARP